MLENQIIKNKIWKMERLLGETLREGEIPAFIYEMSYLQYIDDLEVINNFVKQNKNYDLDLFIKLFREKLELSGQDELAREILDRLTIYTYKNINLGYYFKLTADLDKSSIEELMKIDIYESIGFTRDTQENVTQREIGELANKILDIKKDDYIADFGSGIGNFLIYANALNNYGIEINVENALVSKIRLKILNKKYEIELGNLLTTKIDQKFDKIFSQFPCAIRLDKSLINEMTQKKKLKFAWDKLPSTSSEWIFINNIVSNLKKDGRAVTIIPDGPLFKTADYNFKKDLCEKGLLEAIIKLPSGGTLGSSISGNMIVLSSNNQSVKMIDAQDMANGEMIKTIDVEKIYELYKSKNGKKEREVTYKEISANDFILTVNSYVGHKEITIKNPVKLSEYLVDSFRGYQMTSKEQQELEDENGEYEVLLISNIEGGRISNNLRRINAEKSKVARYLIKDGDLIISSKGTRIKIAVAEIGDRKIIATGNLIVLRVEQSKLNPHYLEMFLNSKTGEEILAKIQTGAVIISINHTRLANIEIPKMDIEYQNAISQKYVIKQKQIELTKQNLEKLQNELNDFYDTETEGLSE